MHGSGEREGQKVSDSIPDSSCLYAFLGKIVNPK